MKLETRIRRVAAGKVRVRISRRQRGCLFAVRGPDGRHHQARTKTEALQNLLARLRCWEAGEWSVTVEEGRGGR